MRQKIREPIAKRALDCVLEVSSQYGVWIATVGVENQQPVRLYSQLQALADYLEGAVEADEIVIELEKRDVNLLVSCAVFSMCNLVASMEAGDQLLVGFLLLALRPDEQEVEDGEERREHEQRAHRVPASIRTGHEPHVGYHVVPFTLCHSGSVPGRRPCFDTATNSFDAPDRAYT